MGQKELMDYLAHTNCDAEELMDLLRQADVPAQRKMSQKDLLLFASIQISSLGIFKRLSTDDRTPQ